ncbi:MAG: DegT/DnrJ/EryC1/StrS family aminotransferase [Elusimicrobiota bacterium]
MPATIPSAPSKERIESELAAYFGRRHCCLVNRGTTALAAALAALERPGARAIFPAAMCSVPVFAAFFAGWRPAFADVNPLDGNFDLGDLERALAEGGAGAVVPVHMFGRPDDLDALRILCDRHGAALVEDVALSMGASYRGKKAGSFGDLACLSFVRKMIPLEMGGAVLTDDPALDARARRFAASLPPARGGAGETAAAMKAFHALTGYAAAGAWAAAALLEPFREEFRRLLPARTTEEDWAGSIVLDELAGLDAAVAARRKRAEVYDTVLSHPRLRPFPTDGSCLFAYPVRLAGVSAERFLEYAARRGCSFKRIAYPDVHRVFGPAGAFPGAALLERELVGFPVDDDQPVSSFWEYVRDFLDLFESYLKDEKTLPPFDERGKLELRMGGS